MVMASLCIAVFVDGRVVLCLHRGRCVARSSHGSVQCCIQALLQGPASVRGYAYTAPSI